MKGSEYEYEIPFGSKAIRASFDGGHISSDSGLLLLGQTDKALGLTRRLAGCIKDGRDQGKVKQGIWEMVRQRVFGIAEGYEDCNDHDSLRGDAMLKLSVGRDPLTGEDLASQPTLTRFENSVSKRDLWRMAEAMIAQFIEGHFGSQPRRLVIDADATDDPTHGQQELGFFHGYYDCYCYLPLLVFVTADGGEQELVASVLRPGNVHAGHRVVCVVSRIVARLKEAFPDAEIVLRGDAGMALPEVYDFCEDAGVAYLISLPKNSRLLELGEEILRDARAQYEETGEKVRDFGELGYAAQSWRSERRVIMKAEVVNKGENPRFLVTNMADASPDEVYEQYIGRGDVENRIKELKGGLVSGRTSCHSFWANQFRLILHSAAFILMQALRKLLEGTEMACAQVETLRAKLLKVGARVRETTRRIWIEMPTSYPYKRFWDVVLTRMALARS
jgi:hypothetical protein